MSHPQQQARELFEELNRQAEARKQHVKQLLIERGESTPNPNHALGARMLKLEESFSMLARTITDKLNHGTRIQAVEAQCRSLQASVQELTENLHSSLAVALNAADALAKSHKATVSNEERTATAGVIHSLNRLVEGMRTQQEGKSG